MCSRAASNGPLNPTAWWLSASCSGQRTCLQKWLPPGALPSGQMMGVAVQPHPAAWPCVGCVPATLLQSIGQSVVGMHGRLLQQSFDAPVVTCLPWRTTR